mmetsp:Transcript_21841/g.50315  ORF Transcript_21841/g.50315 Transcript_21841/m.50315 type:complete len:634 (-) Transcript_21841:2634-4535(-)
MEGAGRVRRLHVERVLSEVERSDGRRVVVEHARARPVLLGIVHVDLVVFAPDRHPPSVGRVADRAHPLLRLAVLMHHRKVLGRVLGRLEDYERAVAVVGLARARAETDADLGAVGLVRNRTRGRVHRKDLLELHSLEVPLPYCAVIAHRDELFELRIVGGVWMDRQAPKLALEVGLHERVFVHIRPVDRVHLVDLGALRAHQDLGTVRRHVDRPDAWRDGGALQVAHVELLDRGELKVPELHHAVLATRAEAAHVGAHGRDHVVMGLLGDGELTREAAVHGLERVEVAVRRARDGSVVDPGAAHEGLEAALGGDQRLLVPKLASALAQVPEPNGLDPNGHEPLAEWAEGEAEHLALTHGSLGEQDLVLPVVDGEAVVVVGAEGAEQPPVGRPRELEHGAAVEATQHPHGGTSLGIPNNDRGLRAKLAGGHELAVRRDGEAQHVVRMLEVEVLLPLDRVQADAGLGGRVHHATGRGVEEVLPAVLGAVAMDPLKSESVAGCAWIELRERGRFGDGLHPGFGRLGRRGRGGAEAWVDFLHLDGIVQLELKLQLTGLVGGGLDELVALEVRSVALLHGVVVRLGLVYHVSVVDHGVFVHLPLHDHAVVRSDGNHMRVLVREDNVAHRVHVATELLR